MDIAGSKPGGSLNTQGGVRGRNAYQSQCKPEYKIKQEVPVAAARYREELLAEINADREAHGKKPFKDDDDPPKPEGKNGTIHRK